MNNNTYILSDEDTDGMCSSRIIHNAMTTKYPRDSHTLVYQDWDTFGLKDGDLDKILAAKPNRAYILDIGSGLEMLEAAKTLLENNIGVTILDNHPPDPLVETAETMDSYLILLNKLRAKYGSSYAFFYHSTTESCTAAISYTYCDNLGLPYENMDKWALIGIKGDVATTHIESGTLYKILMAKHGSFNGLLVSKDLGGSYDWGLIDFYARLIHAPRRMLFNEAPAAVYSAMVEMEKMDNWLPLYDQVYNRKTVFEPFRENCPATANLLDLQLEWMTEHVKVEGIGKNIRLDYPDFGVTMVSHKWNLGSALAAKLSGMNRNKTWFVINDITDKGIHVSGRGQEGGKLHVGKVFRSCNPDIMKGGGLQPAGSANVFVDNVEEVLDELVRAVKVSRQ